VTLLARQFSTSGNILESCALVSIFSLTVSDGCGRRLPLQSQPPNGPRFSRREASAASEAVG
jgi:hypothetical protein